MVAQVIDLLIDAGYEISSDDKTVNYILNRTIDKAKNHCHIKKISEDMETLIIDMSVTAYIQLKESVKAINRQDEGVGMVTSIKAGDEQTNFDSGSNNITMVSKYIESAINEHKKELNTFRKLRWPK